MFSYLKESFVEDYRIGLNLACTQGIFELPNAYCFHGDFLEPELMDEGVNIVRTTIRNHQESLNKQDHVETVYEAEPDRVAIIDRFLAAGALDFVPGQVKKSDKEYQMLMDRVKDWRKRSL